MKPFLEFTIQADRNTYLIWRVKVWRTYSQLQFARSGARRASKIKRDYNECDGFTHKFHERNSHDLCIGEIHFAKTHLTVEVIAHEAVHAATHLCMIFRPRSHDPGKRDSNERDCCITETVIDEAIAYPTGFIAEGVIWNLRREKLKIKPL